MLGAPALAARAALRAGAGLVRLLCPERILNEVIAVTPEATGVGLRCDEAGHVLGHEAATTIDVALSGAGAVIVGPGLGMGALGSGLAAGTAAVVLRVTLHSEVPVVLDADALNCLSVMPEFWRDLRAPAILTPHPGEAARLARALALPAPGDDDDSRTATCEGLARRLGVVVVLKGSRTVVSDGLRTWRCERGHACLATAGTGDVLAGVIGAMLAPRTPIVAGTHGPTDLFTVACAAVEAHAIAGENWAARQGASGLLAHELADEVPRVMERMRAE